MAGVAHSYLHHTLLPHARLYVVAEIDGENDPSRHKAVYFQLALCRASCMGGLSHRSCALAFEASLMYAPRKHVWRLHTISKPGQIISRVLCSRGKEYN